MTKDKKEPNTPSVRCIGGSHDCRTNRWSATCACAHNWEPPTTMMATQTDKCPRCSREYFFDYNAIPPVIKQIDGPRKGWAGK